MDIPELIRQLLELKFRLKEKYSMQILITTDNTLRVRFWMNDGDQSVCNMNLSDWSTKSRDFLDACWGTAKEYKLLDEQEFLPFK